jgi:hypothetical protein
MTFLNDSKKYRKMIAADKREMAHLRQGQRIAWQGTYLILPDTPDSVALTRTVRK